MSAVQSGMRRVSEGAPKFELKVMDGKKLERWGLKTLLNHATWNGYMYPNTQCDLTGDRILAYVFGKAPRPIFFGMGFYRHAPIPREDFERNVFDLHQRNVERSDEREGALNKSRPHYLSITALGLRIGVFANLTEASDNEWQGIVSTQED